MNIIKRRVRALSEQIDGQPKCAKCESTEVQTECYSDTVDFRGIELDVIGLERSVCSSCSHTFESREQSSKNSEIIRTAYSVERDRLRERDGLLSSTDIERIRAEFGLAQREAALLFGGGPNAFNKYESGEVLQSLPMDRLLRLAKAFGPSSLDVLRSLAERRLPALGERSAAPAKIPERLQVSFANTVVHITNQQTVMQVINVLREKEYKKEVFPLELVSETTSGGAHYIPSRNYENFTEIQ